MILGKPIMTSKRSSYIVKNYMPVCRDFYDIIVRALRSVSVDVETYVNDS